MLNAESSTPILSLSPCADDHAALSDILEPYEWTMHRASTLSDSKQLLRRHSIGVVVCDRDLPPHSWKDLLSEVAGLPKPPLIIVTSRHADDYLWAEALNLGAYDVLPKPFDAAEVRRTVRIAALHWQWNGEPALPLVVKMAGASEAARVERKAVTGGRGKKSRNSHSGA
jgi:DNA-binding response OmpR family regulator